MLDKLENLKNQQNKFLENIRHLFLKSLDQSNRLLQIVILQMAALNVLYFRARKCNLKSTRLGAHLQQSEIINSSSGAHPR